MFVSFQRTPIPPTHCEDVLWRCSLGYGIHGGGKDPETLGSAHNASECGGRQQCLSSRSHVQPCRGHLWRIPKQANGMEEEPYVQIQPWQTLYLGFSTGMGMEADLTDYTEYHGISIILSHSRDIFSKSCTSCTAVKYTVWAQSAVFWELNCTVLGVAFTPAKMCHLCQIASLEPVNNHRSLVSQKLLKINQTTNKSYFLNLKQWKAKDLGKWPFSINVMFTISILVSFLTTS